MRSFVSVRQFWPFWLLLALVLCGCGRSDPQRAQDTAQKFMDAVNSGDRNALTATLTQKAREHIGNSADSSTNGKSTEYRLGDATVTEDTATVPVIVKENGKESQTHLHMRREDGEWRVNALSLDDPGITIDFENPDAFLGDFAKVIPGLFRSLGQGMGEMFKGMMQGVGEGLKSLQQNLQQAPASH